MSGLAPLLNVPIQAPRRVTTPSAWASYDPDQMSAAAASFTASGTQDLGFGDTQDTDTISGPPWDFTEYNEDKPQTTLDKMSFLRLLVEQLKNQDPLNPMDGTEYVAQLATFAQLEQQYNTNDLLTTILAYESSINTAQSMSLLGRDVRVTGDLITLEDEQASPASYILPDDGEVTIKIYDQQGELVRTIEKGEQAAGEHEFVWDGQDDFGETLSDGAYTFEVSANGADDLPLEVVQICQGPVTGIKFDDNGVPLLLVGSYSSDVTDENGEPIDGRIEAYLSDVIEILTAADGEDGGTVDQTLARYARAGRQRLNNLARAGGWIKRINRLY